MVEEKCTVFFISEREQKLEENKMYINEDEIAIYYCAPKKKQSQTDVIDAFFSTPYPIDLQYWKFYVNPRRANTPFGIRRMGA